jgi:hypothetical protein
LASASIAAKQALREDRSRDLAAAVDRASVASTDDASSPDVQRAEHAPDGCRFWVKGYGFQATFRFAVEDAIGA